MSGRECCGATKVELSVKASDIWITSKSTKIKFVSLQDTSTGMFRCVIFLQIVLS